MRPRLVGWLLLRPSSPEIDSSFKGSTSYKGPEVYFDHSPPCTSSARIMAGEGQTRRGGRRAGFFSGVLRRCLTRADSLSTLLWTLSLSVYVRVRVCLSLSLPAGSRSWLLERVASSSRAGRCWPLLLRRSGSDNGREGGRERQTSGRRGGGPNES